MVPPATAAMARGYARFAVFLDSRALNVAQRELTEDEITRIFSQGMRFA